MSPTEGLAAQDAQLTRLAHGLELARAERNAAQTRAAQLDREAERLKAERDEAVAARERMAIEVMTALAGAGIATPVEGYVSASWAVSGDIARLAKERDQSRAEAELFKHELAVLEQALESTHRAECAAVDPKPTPPVDVPNLGPRSPADLCATWERAEDTVGALIGLRPVETPPERPRAKHVEQPKRPRLRAASTANGCVYTMGGEVITPEKWAEEWIARHGTGEPVVAGGMPAKHLEQPMPTGDGCEVFRVAIAECPSVSLRETLMARERIGIERYGTTLKTHNGRDVVRDLREELADAYVYATQAGMEEGEPPPDHLLRSVRWALVEAWRAVEEHEYRRQPRAHESSPTAVEFVDLTGGAS